MSDRAEWLRIEGEAREQCAADLALLERTPLEVGAPIAWVECLLAHTNGLSPLHRVGKAQFGSAYTACGDLIPSPVRWIPVSPAMARTMAPCRDCIAALQRMTRERAA